MKNQKLENLNIFFYDKNCYVFYKLDDLKTFYNIYAIRILLIKTFLNSFKNIKI